MVGTRLYFDVYSEDKIDRQIPALVKELRDRGRISPVFEPFDQGEINKHMIRVVSLEKGSLGFPTRTDTNQPLQSQMKARSLKFGIKEAAEFYL